MSTPAVTPDPQVQATPEGAAPPPVTATPEGGPAPAPAAPQAPPDSQADPAKHGWRNVVVGALKGLALGGVPGAIQGGVDPNRANAAYAQQQQTAQAKLQQAQANVKFQNASAAETVANAQYHDALRQQLPKELQAQASQRDQSMVQFFIDHGIQPHVVTDNTADGAQAGLEQLTSAHGAVPPLTVFHLGDKLVGFDLNQVGNNQQLLPLVNQIGSIVGRPQVDLATWNKLPAGAKAKAVDEASHFFNPPVQGSDKIDGQIEQYKNYAAAAALAPDSPEKPETVSKLKGVVDYLQRAKAANQKSKVELAGVRGSAAQNARAVAVVDDQGQLSYQHAGDAIASGTAPAAQGVQALAKEAQFKEIVTASGKLRQAIKALPDTPFTPKDIASLTLATRSSDPKVLSNIAASFAGNQQLTPEQRAFAVWATQLNERALSLRNVAGMGQGSDDLRKAIQATLPSLRSGDKDMMNRQLDAFDQQVQQLHLGVPKVKGHSTPALTQSAPAASSFTHMSASGDYGWDGSKWVKVTK